MLGSLARAALAASLILSSPLAAFANCGAASCSMDLENHEKPRAGLRLDASLQYIGQDRPRVGGRPGYVGQVPGAEHNEVSTFNRIWTLRADYDLDSRWGVGLLLPIVSRSHDHLVAATGEGEHWSFTGAGDLIGSLRYAVLPRNDEGKPSLVLSGGVKFPTGYTQARNDAEPAEVTIQPGTGSFDFIGGAVVSLEAWRLRNLQGTAAPVPVFAGVSYRQNNPGSRRYRFGDSVQVNAGGSFAVLDALDVLAQTNWVLRRRDVNGDTGEDTSFTGGQYLYLSPGLRWHATKAVSFYGMSQFPVYEYVSQEQIVAPYNLAFGATLEY